VEDDLSEVGPILTGLLCDEALALAMNHVTVNDPSTRDDLSSSESSTSISNDSSHSVVEKSDETIDSVEGHAASSEIVLPDFTGIRKSQLAADLQQLYLQSNDSDVTLTVDEFQFHVHRFGFESSRICSLRKNDGKG